MRLGVLGVGRMGGPILARLEAGGHEVLAWDPVTRPLPGISASSITGGAEISAAGISAGSITGGAEISAAGISASSITGGAEILITILPGAPEVAELFETLTVPPGTLWLDLTSNDPRVAQRIAASGVETVGAPMGGGVSAATTGDLHFFVGGAAASIDRVRPVLELLGTIEIIGEDVGDGYTAKLLANLLWFGQAVAVTEALLLGQSLGLAPAALKQTLAASAGGSVFITEYLDRLLDGDYLEGFGIDRVVEELETLASLARQEGVPFELSTLIARQHRDALERFGAVGGELLAAKLLEEKAGRTLRR